MTTYSPPPPPERQPLMTVDRLLALARDVAVILIAVVYVIESL